MDVGEKSSLILSVTAEPPDEPAALPPHHQHQERNDAPVRRSLILVTLPVFMGYAALVSFQADLKRHMGIAQDSAESYAFGTAISLLFLAALFMRLMHNVVLGFLIPRHRVVLAFVMMVLATASVLFIFYVGRVTSLAAVFLVYITGGIAIGTFEVNIVSFITPLGAQSKKYALLGMPVGYNGVSIGGFLLFAAFPGDPLVQGLVFGLVALLSAVGLVFFLCCVPDVKFEASEDTASVAWENVKKWREWLPLLKFCCVALFVDMFCCILAGSIALYIFDGASVVLWPRASAKIAIPQNLFFALFNGGSCVGDSVGRIVAYGAVDGSIWRVREGNPMRFTVLTAIGVALCLCKVAVVAPIGMFAIMLGNGLIYASTTRFLDESVPPQYSLVALSFFLFAGDVGSTIASNIVTPIQVAIGTS